MIEKHFNINIDVYSLDVKGELSLRIDPRSITKYDDALNLMRYYNHFMYFKHLQQIRHIHRCRKCDKICNNMEACNRHEKTYSEIIKYIFHGGKYNNSNYIVD